jgi:hypothetical protein
VGVKMRKLAISNKVHHWLLQVVLYTAISIPVVAFIMIEFSTATFDGGTLFYWFFKPIMILSLLFAFFIRKTVKNLILKGE